MLFPKGICPFCKEEIEYVNADTKDGNESLTYIPYEGDLDDFNWAYSCPDCGEDMSFDEIVRAFCDFKEW